MRFRLGATPGFAGQQVQLNKRHQHRLFYKCFLQVLIISRRTPAAHLLGSLYAATLLIAIRCVHQLRKGLPVVPTE